MLQGQSGTPLTEQGSGSVRWWREWELLFVAALVLATFFSRLTALHLQGEETRRALVACEMLWSGDWIVPRLQGWLYLSRPPAGSWPIAVMGLLRGELDVVAIRLPTVTAVLLTSLLIYGYSRTFLTRLGAMTAALAYPTMGQVLQIGRFAENEGLYTLFVGGSLLVWHWGHLQGWKRHGHWALAAALAALAGLTKGAQGPCYFFGPVYAYLLWRRDWKQFFGRGNAVGLAVFAAIIGAWQIPYLLDAGWSATAAIWGQQAANRFEAPGAGALVEHLVTYPFEILVCMLPWSLGVVQLFNRRFRESVDDVRPQITFLLIALAVTFPTVWLAPTARGRYFMPLYPVCAVLWALVLERCLQAERGSLMHRGWQAFAIGIGLAVVIGSLIVVALPWLPDSRLSSSAPGVPAASAYFVAAGLVAWLLFIGSGDCRLPRARAAIAALAGFLGLTYTGIIVDAQARSQRDVVEAMRIVRSQIPEERVLVSLGKPDHAFAFHYGRPMTRLDWSESQKLADVAGEYFCYRTITRPEGPLPFAWETVAEVSLGHIRGADPHDRMIVARLIPRRRATARLTETDIETR